MSEARYLGKVAGYVGAPERGLFAEPEPLSEADQADVTAQAHRAVEDARRTEWRLAVERTEKSLAHYAAQARACERQLSRLQRKLAGG